MKKILSFLFTLLFVLSIASTCYANINFYPSQEPDEEFRKNAFEHFCNEYESIMNDEYSEEPEEHPEWENQIEYSNSYHLFFMKITSFDRNEIEKLVKDAEIVTRAEVDYVEKTRFYELTSTANNAGGGGYQDIITHYRKEVDEALNKLNLDNADVFLFNTSDVGFEALCYPEDEPPVMIVHDYSINNQNALHIIYETYYFDSYDEYAEHKEARITEYINFKGITREEYDRLTEEFKKNWEEAQKSETAQIKAENPSANTENPSANTENPSANTEKPSANIYAIISIIAVAIIILAIVFVIFKKRTTKKAQTE